MKKLLLPLLAIVSMNSVGFAASYELDDTENAPEDKGFYIGLAYSHLSHDIDHESSTIQNELDFPALMLDVGYKFNPYIAIVGRYNITFDDTDMDDQVHNADMSVLSFFVKPMYPLAPEMDIYALLGYSLTDASYANNKLSLDEGAFSWGAGASYDMTEDISVFVEYTQFYNDTLNGFDHVVDSFNLGLNYKF